MGRLILAACLVVPAMAACAGAGRPARTAGGAGEPAPRVLEALDDKDQVLSVGHSTTWHVWVEGNARQEVAVRLHNSSPSVLRVKGGDDQIVRLRGGRDHEIRLRITAVGLGASRLGAQIHYDDAHREAVALAEVLAPLLRQIETEFAGRRRSLAGSGADPYPLAAVSRLVAETEAAIEETLNYPELAALRDYAADRFARARAELGAERRTETRRRGARVALAAFSPAGSPGPPPADRPVETIRKEAANSVLDQVARLLAKIGGLAANHDLAVDLCIRSTPLQRAVFNMRPLKYPRVGPDTTTDGRLPAYRGLYVYRMAKRGERSIECGWPGGARKDCTLDLVDNSQPILTCDFRDGLCQRQDGSADACGSGESHGR